MSKTLEYVEKYMRDFTVVYTTTDGKQHKATERARAAHMVPINLRGKLFDKGVTGIVIDSITEKKAKK